MVHGLPEKAGEDWRDRAVDRSHLLAKDQADPYWTTDGGPVISSSEGPAVPDRVVCGPLSNQKTPTVNPPTRKRIDGVSYAIENDGSLMTGVGGSGAGQSRSG